MRMLKNGVKRALYKLKYINKNVKFGKRVAISFRNAQFEGFNVIGDEVAFTGKLGYGSYIGAYSNINAKI